MEFCGIICEFNPFHNGHKYLIEEAKKITGKEVLCLMSGNFVQRGEPAITDKYTRAKIAIENGANCVLELPTIYACSNAENFAMGAIKILSRLNVSYLAFGVEQTDISILSKIAELKFKNSERFKNAFKNEIQNGINYNTALKRSIANTIGDEHILEILNKPNNILAIEYLTAIKKLGSKIIPIAIPRCDNGYVSNKENKQFLSATSIRDRLKNLEKIDDFIPKNAKLNKIFSKNSDLILKTIQIHKIRTSSPQTLEKCYDYSEGIEYRIKKIADECENYEKIIEKIETPRYRLPRVNKLLLYPILNITKSVVKQSYNTKPVCKVLAIQKSKKNLLFEYNKNKITLISNNKIYNLLSKSQKSIIDVDLNASCIYYSITEEIGNKDKKIGTLFLD